MNSSISFTSLSKPIHDETVPLKIRFRIQILRDIKMFFGTSFKIVAVDSSEGDDAQTKVEGELMVSCYGSGFINSNRNAA